MLLAEFTCLQQERRYRRRLATLARRQDIVVTLLLSGITVSIGVLASMGIGLCSRITPPPDQDRGGVPWRQADHRWRNGHVSAQATVIHRLSKASGTAVTRQVQLLAVIYLATAAVAWAAPRLWCDAPGVLDVVLTAARLYHMHVHPLMRAPQWCALLTVLAASLLRSRPAAPGFY